VRRTDQALVQALVSLVFEKGYDAITIQDLLDRADVGRSTFYAHYRGKDDLLLTSFRRLLDHLDRMLDRDGNPGGRIAPVQELFAHVASARRFERALSRSHMVERQFHAGIQQLSGSIARRLAIGGPDGTFPIPVRAQALAGGLFAMLRWWLDGDMPYSPEEMDRMFHAL